jgi:hypothetical protein
MRGALLIGVLLIGVIGVRIFDSQRGAPLAPWRTLAPRTDWAGYLKAEDEAFAQMRKEVTDKLTTDEQLPSNRYFAGSPTIPGSFAQDWNRSYELEPAGAPDRRIKPAAP